LECDDLSSLFLWATCRPSCIRRQVSGPKSGDKSPSFHSKITFERSYFARLNYVHQNAVHHGLVRVANQHPWCSAAWFERTATPAQVKTIYSFKIDKLQIPDDF